MCGTRSVAARATGHTRSSWQAVHTSLGLANRWMSHRREAPCCYATRGRRLPHPELSGVGVGCVSFANHPGKKIPAEYKQALVTQSSLTLGLPRAVED